MTTFPLTESLGIEVTKQIRVPESRTYPNGLVTMTGSYVYAPDLEAILEKAQRVYGYKSEQGRWEFNETFSGAPMTIHTHYALLVNIQPIQRKVTKRDISDAIESFGQHQMTNLLKRILEHGVE